MDSIAMKFGFVMLAAYCLLGVWKLYLRILGWLKGTKNSPSQDIKQTQLDTKNTFEACNITPLPDFNWQTTEPLKFRPFKPKYHLTMGINNTTLSNLLEMDKNYLSRLQLRREIIAEHHDIVIQASPRIQPAVLELYNFLTNIYLPTRFPSMFKLSAASLLNLTTRTAIPVQAPQDAIRSLEILGENIDEEFLLLGKSRDGDGYVLEGFVNCFPSGFDTKEKWGLKLRDIHGVVPGYKEKLEKSMDRFFERLEVGRVVLRTNWSITTHDHLFAASGNHLYEGEEAVEEEIDINNTFLRCERQLLHRLPRTRAIVFSFKTYLYSLQEIKDEGLGAELAQAIDGLKEGSVPAMHFYKKGVVWGEKVKEFLRS